MARKKAVSREPRRRVRDEPTEILEELHESAQKAGSDKLSIDEINTLIRKARKKPKR